MLSEKANTKPQTEYASIYSQYLEEENLDRRQSGGLWGLGGGWRRGPWELLINRCGVLVWQNKKDCWERVVVLKNMNALDPVELYTQRWSK